MNKISHDRPKGPFSSIRAKLLVYFILLFTTMITVIELARIYGVPLTNIEGEYRVEQNRAFKNLNLVADMKKERLMRWMEERRDDSDIIAKSRLITQHLTELRALIRKYDMNNIEAGAFRDELNKSSAFLLLNTHLNLIIKAYGVYESIDIVDADNRRIIVSSHIKRIGKTLDDHTHLSGPAQITEYDVRIEFDPDDNKFDLVIYRPIKVDNIRIALLIIHVDPDDFIKPMMHTGGGLGETGEVLLVDQDVKILTSVRHILADGTSPEPLKFIVKAKPAQFAARGEEGIIESLDYRGKQVLAAYRHLRITHEIGWGMVIKRDVSEIFAPFKEALVRSIVITIFGLFLVIALISVITRKITRPIINLTHVVEKVEKGNFKQKAEDITGDEIGILAISFNRMIDRMNDARERDERNEWLKTGQIELNEKMRGNPGISELADSIVRSLAEYMDAKIGALYVMDSKEEVLDLTGYYAFDRSRDFNERFRVKEGIVGQAAYSKKMISLTDIPENYTRISSAVGEATPGNIVVTPFIYEGKVIGVIELGAFRKFSDTELEFLDAAMESVAVGVNSARTRTIMKEMLENTRTQARKLQSQQEELKSSNEELEEQTQALQASEEELKTQQEELQSTNEELEQKTDALEKQQQETVQKNLSLQDAQADLKQKARELEITSRYKSEFLANMSHELRTPLNSLLILSQYLASNKEENLNKEQLESVSIIQSSGEDLLKLIDDILDLSKIEAGRMTINIEDVILSEVTDFVDSNFKHITGDKGLELTVTIEKEMPRSIRTDRQRLDQIMKNLMSNAIKFTEKGSIKVDFHKPAPDVDLSRSGLDIQKSIAVSVIDTGIGIPEERRSEIFEAFQQVDGSTSRKYGGTGLGLSISRELVKLLGGEIQLESREGKGAEFTVYLPEDLSDVRERGTEAGDVPTVIGRRPGTTDSEPQPRTQPAPSIKDDRDDITENDKVLLVIEDDLNFANVLYKFSHEWDFKFIHAGDGETGLKLSHKYKPDAIILDMKLPGIGGGNVLETLKSDPGTRHIPVHIISVEEETIDVFKSGAIGYLQKPVNAEQLKQAFTSIEDLISRRVKNLIVVEDNKILRKHIRELIGNSDVKIVEVENGKDAIEEIKKNHYDCMILDLKLPDISGFEVLDRLGKSEGVTMPPVIIYTGKDLTREEEYKLHEYASSIIIKGARSEERLLDETALFLHRAIDNMPQKKKEIISRLYDVEAIFKDKKILLADDDMRNVFAISKVLESKGINVYKAVDGQKALDILDSVPDMDLVLMDIMMPVMDGYEAMRRIRSQERFRKLPILAVTAKAMKDDYKKCISAGANDYLSKPIKTEKLLSLMRVWLHK